MSIVDRLRSFLQPKAIDKSSETSLVFIHLPEAIEPEVREARYETPLEAELQLSGLGWVEGGGTLMSAEKADGSRDILSCGIDVDAYDVPAALGLLRAHLPSLGCPVGTRLEYQEPDAALYDEYDGNVWVVRQPQTQRPDSSGD